MVLEYIKNLSGVEIINEEQGNSIIKRYGEYGFSEENEGSYILICEEGMYITIENHSYSECNVEEFETLEEAIKWLN